MRKALDESTSIYYLPGAVAKLLKIAVKNRFGNVEPCAPVPGGGKADFVKGQNQQFVAGFGRMGLVIDQFHRNASHVQDCSSECPFQQSLDNIFRIEILLHQRATELAVFRIISRYSLEALDRLIKTREAKQSSIIWQEPAGAGVLNDGGLAARQVAERPITDPCVLQSHARRLDAAKLTERLLYVFLVPPRSPRNGPGVPYLPAMLAKQGPVSLVFRSKLQRQFEGL